MSRNALLSAAVLPVLLLCACSQPEPPPTDQPPEPQATTDAGAEAHTGLRDAMQRPIDKAEGVEQVQADAAKRQQEEIDAQTGG